MSYPPTPQPLTVKPVAAGPWARLAGPAALALALLSGCAAHFPHQMNGFHEPGMLDSAKAVEVKPSFTAGLTGGAIETQASLGQSGAVGLQYDTSRSSGENAYRLVKVSSAAAPNLRWEVWARTDSALGLGARQYAKIMGPFKNGEEVKVAFVNNGIGQSIERNMMFLVYSPTEAGSSLTLNLSEVRR